MFQKQKYDGEVQFGDSSSRGESLQTETSDTVIMDDL